MKTIMKKGFRLRRLRLDFTVMILICALTPRLAIGANTIAHKEPTQEEDAISSQIRAGALSSAATDLQKLVDEALTRIASQSEKTPRESSEEILRELLEGKAHHMLDPTSKENLNYMREDYLRNRLRDNNAPGILALDEAIQKYQMSFSIDDLYWKDPSTNERVFKPEEAGRVVSVDPKLLLLPDYSKFNFKGRSEDIEKNFQIPKDFAALTEGIAKDFEEQAKRHLEGVDESTIQDENKREAAIASALPLARKYIKDRLALPQPKPGESLSSFESRRQREYTFLPQSGGQFRDLLASEIVLDTHNPYAVYFAARNIDAIKSGKLPAFPSSEESRPLLYRLHSPKTIISRLALEKAVDQYSQSPSLFFSAENSPEPIKAQNPPTLTTAPKKYNPLDILKQEIIEKNYWWSKIGKEGSLR